ncbi:MAG: zinc ABC transporter substrate-binding protein [Clostridiales bacterium]|nr:zinc ABC transporter substrate-binding protein [Clostridiales bacterium]
MRKIGLFAFLLSLMLLTGCSIKPLITDDGPVSIYATCYPVYALTRLVTDGSENYEVYCLIQPQDGCLRSYVLSDWDRAMLLSSANVVVACGRGLESYGEELKSMAQDSIVLVETLYGAELMSFDSESSDEDSHFSGEVPHAFMSPAGCRHMLTSIEGALSALYPDDAPVFSENAENALAKLDQAEAEIERIRKETEGMPVAILNEALIYPADDLGLDVRCVIQRESGEMYSDTGLSDVVERVKQSGATAALIEKQAPDRLVQALRDSGTDVVCMDTMSCVSPATEPDSIFDILTGNALSMEEVE